MSKNLSSKCPCGSGQSLADCCWPAISGEKPAKTAEALMRSRYSAYALENTSYLIASWHASTRPQALQIEPGLIHWLGLTVGQCDAGQPGDGSGRVEFIARYEQDGVQGEVHEDSRFVFEQGQWLYVDGDLKTNKKVGRNDPCPCGSGKKYKKCCA